MLFRKMICNLVNEKVPEALLESLLQVVQQYAAEEMNRRERGTK